MSWLSETAHEVVKFAEQATVNGDALGPIEFWLNRYQGLLGASATLLAGWLAYRAAITTAKRAERRAKDAQRKFLDDRIKRAEIDLDNLKLAPSYLDNLANKFPPTNAAPLEFIKRLKTLRYEAGTTLSHSASAAPPPHGARVATVIERIKTLSDNLNEMETMRGVSIEGITSAMGKDVMAAVDGLGILAKTIRDDIPRAERELIAMCDERDALLK